MKHSSGKKESRSTDWSEVAEWYDALVGDEGSDYQKNLIHPNILRLLAAKENPHQHILDLACGQGVLCRKLARLGHHLTGIDAAQPLIDSAQVRDSAEPSQLNLRYLVADATKLLDAQGKPLHDLTPHSFDAITIILSIQNISPLSPVWLACHTLLKPAGKLLLVMMHPCFRIPQRSDWLWQATAHPPEKSPGKPRAGPVVSGEQLRTIRQYLSSEKIPILTHPGKESTQGQSSPTTLHFHRPLQAYINTLASARLLVDHMEEWPSHKSPPPGPRKSALDLARKEIPLFLALRAQAH